MVSEFETGLASLQYSDSFFPSGAVSFSYGLEALVNDRRVEDEQGVQAFLLEQLLYRWATLDRKILIDVCSANDNLDQVAELDALLHALTLPRELREGSLKAGRALMSVAVQLGHPIASAYADRVRREEAYGHLTVIQALVWSDAQMAPEQCQTAGVHSLCLGILGAAVRLGVIGHISAQKILHALRGQLTAMLASQVVEEVYAYTPISEVAAMRHECQSSRLFAN